MATHGASGLDRVMLGSVADQVVRHAEIPVLLLRPELAQASRPEVPENEIQSCSCRLPEMVGP
jgi:hypothetical protein